MDQLTSLYWWVSVIVVGVLVSLFAAYLKPRTDRFIVSISARYRKRNEKKVRARVQKIETLRGNPHEQAMLAISANYRHLNSISILLLGVSVMLVTLFVSEANSWVRFGVLLFGTITIVIAFLEMLSGMSKRQILREARQAAASRLNASQ